MEKTSWKVGELAEATGLTIRTLHHYHQKEILIPSGTSEAGYRLYSKNDIIRLQQIVALKQFGFSLDRIKSILGGKDSNPIETIRTQLTVVEEQIKLQNKIKFQLETILTVLLNKKATAEDFIKLIGVFTMTTSDLFSKDQIEEMLSKAQSILLTDKLAMIQEFKEFMANLQYCYDNKLPPEDEKVQEAVLYWKKMSNSLGDISKYEKIRKENASLLKNFDMGVDNQKVKLFDYLQNITEGKQMT
jgi:DNA-binding transcriptional MerR regulator